MYNTCMNIAKALKHKNRLVNEIAKLQEAFKRENSRRDDNPSTRDCKVLFDELIEKLNKLTDLRSAIAEATAPISYKLAKLSELKILINYLNGVPTREGKEITAYGTTIKEYVWTSFLNRDRLDVVIKEFQKQIEDLQDEIDDYNARTSVDFVS